MTFFRRTTLLVCLALTACPAPQPTEGDGGSASPDAGSNDLDAGATPDAGATETDAGSTADAGMPTPDAGSLDAGPLADAGTVIDAGVPVAPETTITQRPTAALSGTATATFAFECDTGVCTFACSWDQEPFAACTSPASRSGFTDGRHRFEVRATRDGLTDLTPASEPFVVDAVAPVVSLTTTPASGAPNSRPSTFGAPQCNETPCRFECSLDLGTFAACPSPITFDALSAGAHTLSLRGVDEAGNTSATVTHTWSLVHGWRSANATNDAVCAVTGDRRLACWGRDSSGQLGLGLMPGTESGPESRARPTLVGTATDWDSVVAGANFFCAKKMSGAVQCWGNNFGRLFGDPLVMSGAFNVPTPVAHRFTRLSAGDATACGIDAMGALWCWGSGEFGALGDGNLAAHDTPTPQQVGVASWQSVSVSNHVCGIQTNGSLWCFGPNDSGEVGVDPMTPALGTPTRVGTDTDWSEVSAGDQFTCALKQSGQLFCFGVNDLGELASTAPETPTPTRVGTQTFTAVHASGNGACAVTPANEGFCWGDNGRGALGAGSNVEFATAVTRIATTTPLVRTFGGRRLRCAFTTTDGLECWGDNLTSNGGLGRGVPGFEANPVLLDGSYTSVAITTAPFDGPSTGGCGIKTTGQLVCWGVGAHLGRANAVSSPTPTAVTTDTDWTEVKMSLQSTPLSVTNQSVPGHTCAIRSGLLSCWGRNGWGQLGNGTSTDSVTPTPVPPFGAGTTWVRVAVGNSSSCGITSAGRLSCWGQNQQGQVGDGTQVIRLSPSGLAGTANTFTDWTQVSVNQRVVARRGNGTLWQWGSGATSTPTQVDAATDWVEGSATAFGWCGRKTNGTAHCKANAQAAATQLDTFTDAVGFSDNPFNACVVRASGVVSCFRWSGTAWTAAGSVPGTWKTFVQSSTFSCGVGLDDQRRCFLGRFMGSFGDGVDERVPGPVLAP